MEPIVEAVGLTKHFGEVHALDGLDLYAERGKVLAVLGPNGAGKTTFIRAVATLRAARRRHAEASPASTSPPTRPRCAASSAWPASTPRSSRR